MKLFQIVSVLVLIVSVLSFTQVAFAAIQFYGADVDLMSGGNAKIKLTITFESPVKGFQLAVFGAVKNFNASSNSGPVDCKLESGAASIIDCKMNMTQDKRTLELNFESADFVKKVNEKNLFSLDLSLSDNISQSSANVRLPEGYALTDTSSIPSISPPTNSIVSDGRRIIVNWNLANLTAEQPFKFQTLYEPTRNLLSGWFVFGVPGIASLGALSLLLLGGGIFFYRRMKQPKEVILSVLDDFERRVIEIIEGSNGEINQRRVVHETNLSKAKVSRVVKRLQERGLIEVIRLGRTNKLKLIQKKFEGN
ncbi:MAG: winged helix-turn-helix transcriptional regulator [Candidatus Aenigmarchaeota archaeon]|nr:winged helix-turn-helix transcriptional regulator [Candidatus Aenigmarchaeota archaeon]